MSQDIFPHQDSDTSAIAPENQVNSEERQSSILSNSNPPEESQLLLDEKKIERIVVSIAERRLDYLEHSGPLPHPEILDGYEKVLPGSADRILKMAEKQQDHRTSIENKLVNAENQSRLLGLGAGFLIAMFGLAGSVYLGSNGKTWASGILSGGTLAGLVTVFVKGSNNNNQEKEKIVPNQNDVES